VSVDFRSLLHKPATAATLSFLLPGLGQAAVGDRRRAAVIALPALSLAAVALAAYLFARKDATNALETGRWFLSLLIVDVLALVYHLWAILDAYFGAQTAASRRGRAARVAPKAGIAMVLVLVVASL